MSGLSYEYILKHDCDKPHCADNASNEERARHIEWITSASEYAEKGYSAPDKCILFGDWNYFSRRAADLLERAGYKIEWEDEWSTCGECGKAVRTETDSYQWTPYYVILNDCELVCMDCLDKEEYLAGIENDPDVACLPEIDPSEYGYEKVAGDFENGFYQGMNDNPKKIFEEWSAKGYKRLLFKIAEKSQFYITFELWNKPDENEEEE